MYDSKMKPHQKIDQKSPLISLIMFFFQYVHQTFPQRLNMFNFKLNMFNL